jgi:multiple sugar transport system permease protein
MANVVVDTRAAGRTAQARTQPRITAGRVLAWIVVALLVLVTIFPFYWALRTALSTSRLLFSNPGSLLPVGFTLDNFGRVLGLLSAEESIAAGGSGQTLNFWLYLRNSIVVVTLITVGQVFFSAMAAYSFARLHWPMRDQLFSVFLAALMAPGIVLLIPNFILIRNLGWLNTYWGIAAPYFLMTPFAIFFLRQFFLGINSDIEESAKLDGAGYFAIFRRIILPISQPPMMTLAIITFITHWNDYLWPLLVGRRENVRVLTVALGVFRSQTPQGAPDWTGLMAGTILSVIPIFLIFILLGRRVVDAIQFTGIK